MAKPQIATRVDTGVKKRIEQYADEQDVTESEAMRHLLSRGLDYEAGELVATDGGVADRLDQIETRQQRREEIESLRTVVLGVGAAYIIAALFADFSGLSAVITGLAVLALLAYPAYQLRQLGGEEDV